MDDFNDQTPSNHPPYSKGIRKNRLFIPIIIGVVIGVLLTIIISPIILNVQSPQNNMVREQSFQEDYPHKERSIDREQVAYDVTTQITEVVGNVSPAVVGVTNIQREADFWSQQEHNEAGTGSGVIYKQEGEYTYVVTNYHVIEGSDSIEVVLFDETHLEAELLGSDLFTDLAVLRMNQSDVEKAIELGFSDQLKVGEPAIAIGNPLGHMFSGTVTTGVISGTQRTIPLDFNQDGRADWQAEVIQTDAAINPGNSGGALINIKGQLIGINSMKINQTAVEGIGFAIPIDIALPVMQQLEKSGEVIRPYLGVEIYSLEEVPQLEWERTLKLPSDVKGGVYVWSVEPLSPANQGGLERLDVITELDGIKIMDTIDLRKVLFQDKDIGEEVIVTFYRGGEEQKKTIKLGIQE